MDFGGFYCLVEKTCLKRIVVLGFDLEFDVVLCETLAARLDYAHVVDSVYVYRTDVAVHIVVVVVVVVVIVVVVDIRRRQTCDCAAGAEEHLADELGDSHAA